MCIFNKKDKKKSYFDYIIKNNLIINKEEHNQTDNIYPAGITENEFVSLIKQYLFDSSKYFVDPLNSNQVNQLIVEEILYKYSKKFKRELNFYISNYNKYKK